MPVNSTHPDYEAALPDWLRARDVFAGEESVLSVIATSVSESLTQVLHWVYWWNSTQALPTGLDEGGGDVEVE
jgi:hypothetical protein